MSMPPEPPEPPEPQPHVTPDSRPPGRAAVAFGRLAGAFRSEGLQGALAALVFVVLISVMSGIQSPVIGLTVAPLVALACVVLGSLLAISRQYREFASGCLIASAILMLVTGGVCVAIWSQL